MRGIRSEASCAAFVRRAGAPEAQAQRKEGEARARSPKGGKQARSASSEAAQRLVYGLRLARVNCREAWPPTPILVLFTPFF